MSDEIQIHHYLSTAVGWLELRASEQGIRSISYVNAPKRKRSVKGYPVMDVLIKELDLYFSGEPVSFAVPLDPATGTEFQRRVWRQLSLIPWGQTRSYGEIAASVGNPQAARAVGSANKANPIPIVVPCHRVINADGSLGGYNSGIHIKKRLLELEQSNPSR